MCEISTKLWSEVGFSMGYVGSWHRVHDDGGSERRLTTWDHEKSCARKLWRGDGLLTYSGMVEWVRMWGWSGLGWRSRPSGRVGLQQRRVPMSSSRASRRDALSPRRASPSGLPAYVLYGEVPWKGRHKETLVWSCAFFSLHILTVAALVAVFNPRVRYKRPSSTLCNQKNYNICEIYEWFSYWRHCCFNPSLRRAKSDKTKFWSVWTCNIMGLMFFHPFTFLIVFIQRAILISLMVFFWRDCFHPHNFFIQPIVVVHMSVFIHNFLHPTFSYHSMVIYIILLWWHGSGSNHKTYYFRVAPS